MSQLALNLFYQLQALHKLPEKYASILHAAAMLHDIGMFIADAKHHKHSYYLIKSSGMKSFNKLDLDLVANVARYHRKAHPSQKHLGFSQLSPGETGCGAQIERARARRRRARFPPRTARRVRQLHAEQVQEL